ncbi:hypothetical protein [Streptomyces sp. NPDC002156]
MTGIKTTAVPSARVHDSAPPAERTAKGKDLLQIAAGLLSFTAVIVYGVQYLALERFYEVFGITPEQAGIGKTEMLTRLTVWLALLASLVMVLLPLCNAVGLLIVKGVLGEWWAPLCRWLFGCPDLRTRGVLARPAVRKWGSRTVLVGVGGAWAGMTLFLEPGPRSFALLPRAEEWAIGALLMGMALTLAVHLPRRRRPLGEVFIAITLTVLAGSYSISENMGERAEAVMRTGRWGFREQFIGLRLQYVKAEFVRSAGSPARTDFTGIYLGEASGVYALYDCAAGRVLRVSVAQVQLAHEADNSAIAGVRRNCRTK